MWVRMTYEFSSSFLLLHRSEWRFTQSDQWEQIAESYSKCLNQGETEKQKANINEKGYRPLLNMKFTVPKFWRHIYWRFWCWINIPTYFLTNEPEKKAFQPQYIYIVNCNLDAVSICDVRIRDRAYELGSARTWQDYLFARRVTFHFACYAQKHNRFSRVACPKFESTRVCRSCRHATKTYHHPKDETILKLISDSSVKIVGKLFFPSKN